MNQYTLYLNNQRTNFEYLAKSAKDALRRVIRDMGPKYHITVINTEDKKDKASNR